MVTQQTTGYALQDDSPVEIRLRRKYMRHVHGTYRSTHNMQGAKKRKKIGYDRHVALYGPPTLKFLEVGVTGKKVFRLA